MAKLTHGNLLAKENVKISQVDIWNPPVVSTAKAAAATMQMPPPQSRPQPKIPKTPSHNGPLSSLGSAEQNSSSKKKRRRRGGRKNGDSASEIATTVSEDTTQSMTPSGRGAPEVLVEASQPNSQTKLPPLPPDASAEEKRVYENEPEMYGVYASSEDEDENKEQMKSQPIVLPRRERLQTYSPSVVNGIGGSSPIGMNHSAMFVPEPKKTVNGRYKCPFETQYDCAQTFSSARGARRHGDSHVNANRFACEDCGKGFSRKDLFLRHLETHNTELMKKQARRTTVKRTYQADVGNAEAESPETNDLLEDITSAQAGMEDDENTEATEHRSRRDNGDTRKRTKALNEDSVVASVPADSEREDSTFSNNSSTLLTRQRTTRESGSKLKRKISSPIHSVEAAVMPVRKRMRRAQESYPQILSDDVTASQQVDVSEDVPDRKARDHDLGMGGKAEREHVVDLFKGTNTESCSEHTSASEDGVGKKAQAPRVRKGARTANGGLVGAGSTPKPGEHARSTSNTTLRRYRSDTEATDSNSGATIEHEGDEEASDDEREEDNQVEQDAAKTSDVDTKSSAKSAPMITRRQSSMDNFVQRSTTTSTSTSTKASGSNSRVRVNVPERSRKLQTRLTPINHEDMARSIIDSERSSSSNASDDDDDPQVTAKSKGKGKARAVNKTRHEAKVKDIGVHTNEGIAAEQDSSEDHPRATSTARKTASSDSRIAQSGRSKTTSKKRRKVSTDSDASDQADQVESNTPAKKSKKKHAKPSAGKQKSEEDGQPTRKSGVSVADATWAEASKSGLIGRFTDEENHILFSWRDSFCNEHGMSSHEFNEMMTNTTAIRKDQWNYSWITKAEFMQQFYDQLPERNRRSMIRFRERHFQNVEKNPWTQAEDDELMQLVKELGTKWVEIGQMMGRTQDSVSQRWRHKLNYGEKPALMGDWTSEEIVQLEEHVSAFARLKNTTPDNEDLQVPWIAISKKLGTGRTAQQCSNRWRINTSKRVNGKFVKVPHNDRIPGGKVKQPRTPSKMDKRLSGEKMRKKQYKSAERVEDSDADDESQEGAGNDGNEDTEMAGEDTEDDKQHSRETTNEEQQDSDQDMTDEDPESVSKGANETEESETDSSAPETMTTKYQGHTQSPTLSSDAKKLKQPNGRNTSQATRSSSSPQDVRSQLQSQPKVSQRGNSQTSSQDSQTKTPAVSRNPLKRPNKKQSTPDPGLTMTQLHAGTQANSSAKRTTGRTTRTRVPDSAVAEDRPSPGIGMRRRPIRSSSPLMSPLPDVSQMTVGADEDEDDESSTDATRSDMELDFKSPATFVSASSRAPLPHDSVSDAPSQDSSGSASDSNSDSDSESTSSSGSETDSKSNIDSSRNLESRRNSPPPIESSSWTSVNNPIAKVLGYMRGQSQGGASQGRKKGLSLADDLHRRAAGIEDTDSGDD